MAARTRVRVGDSLSKRVRQALKNLGVEVGAPLLRVSKPRNCRKFSVTNPRGDGERRGNGDNDEGGALPASMEAAGLDGAANPQTDARNVGKSDGDTTEAVEQDGEPGRTILENMICGDDLADQFDVSIDNSEDDDVDEDVEGEVRPPARTPGAVHPVSGDDLMDSFTVERDGDGAQGGLRKKGGRKGWLKEIGKEEEGDASKTERRRKVVKKRVKVVKF